MTVRPDFVVLAVVRFSFGTPPVRPALLALVLVLVVLSLEERLGLIPRCKTTIGTFVDGLDAVPVGTVSFEAPTSLLLSSSVRSKPS